MPESTGSSRIPSGLCAIRSCTSLACLSGSDLPSSSTILTPCSSAAALMPRLIAAGKGAARPRLETPIVSSSAGLEAAVALPPSLLSEAPQPAPAAPSATVASAIPAPREIFCIFIDPSPPVESID